jgi:hypothetical protein
MGLALYSTLPCVFAFLETRHFLEIKSYSLKGKTGQNVSLGIYTHVERMCRELRRNFHERKPSLLSVYECELLFSIREST